MAGRPDCTRSRPQEMHDKHQNKQRDSDCKLVFSPKMSYRRSVFVTPHQLSLDRFSSRLKPFFSFFYKATGDDWMLLVECEWVNNFWRCSLMNLIEFSFESTSCRSFFHLLLKTNQECFNYTRSDNFSWILKYLNWHNQKKKKKTTTHESKVVREVIQQNRFNNVCV